MMWGTYDKSKVTIALHAGDQFRGFLRAISPSHVSRIRPSSSFLLQSLERHLSSFSKSREELLSVCWVSCWESRIVCGSVDFGAWAETGKKRCKNLMIWPRDVSQNQKAILMVIVKGCWKYQHRAPRARNSTILYSQDHKCPFPPWIRCTSGALNRNTVHHESMASIAFWCT